MATRVSSSNKRASRFPPRHEIFCFFGKCGSAIRAATGVCYSFTTNWYVLQYSMWRVCLKWWGWNQVIVLSFLLLLTWRHFFDEWNYEWLWIAKLDLLRLHCEPACCTPFLSTNTFFVNIASFHGRSYSWQFKVARTSSSRLHGRKVEDNQYAQSFLLVKTGLNLKTATETQCASSQPPINRYRVDSIPDLKQDQISLVETVKAQKSSSYGNTNTCTTHSHGRISNSPPAVVDTNIDTLAITPSAKKQKSVILSIAVLQAR